MDQSNLARLLDPDSVAVVGASENLGMSNNAVLPMLEAGRDVHLINPNRTSVYGRPTAPSLTAVGQRVDAVLSLVSADRSIDVVAEAAELGCGGVAVAAGGFAEQGAPGAALQARLIAAAGTDLAVIGPNCSGFLNARSGANLFTGGRISLRPGPIAVVSQSGFLLRSCLAAGQQRHLGFGVAVSSGNEAVCGLPDYIELLAGDPATVVICLVIEKVREASSFLTAIERARAAGKAVLALKLGRTEQSRDIMRSHTGAIASESWVYDLALGDAGVVTAHDVDDLLDRAQLLAQLPAAFHRPVRSVAVMASSGGVAGVAADLAIEEGVELADLSGLESWVRQRIPAEDGSLNPLDLTGFVMRDRDLLLEMFTGYAGAEGVDALVLCWWAGEGDEGWAKTLLDPFADAAARAGIPLVVSPVESTAVGSWTEQYQRARSGLLPRAALDVPGPAGPPPGDRGQRRRAGHHHKAGRRCPVGRRLPPGHHPPPAAGGQPGRPDRGLRRRHGPAGPGRRPGRPVRHSGRRYRRRTRRRLARQPAGREAGRRGPPDRGRWGPARESPRRGCRPPSGSCGPSPPPTACRPTWRCR